MHGCTRGRILGYVLHRHWRRCLPILSSSPVIIFSLSFEESIGGIAAVHDYNEHDMQMCRSSCIIIQMNVASATILGFNSSNEWSQHTEMSHISIYMHMVVVRHVRHVKQRLS
eukprot:scaffold373615_cov19-Prasinocladus_malaysianus.AAC.1